MTLSEEKIGEVFVLGLTGKVDLSAPSLYESLLKLQPGLPLSFEGRTRINPARTVQRGNRAERQPARALASSS